MQKKLMAVAVAGALAMPGIAAAQAVSMSGFLKVAVGNIKIGSPNVSRAGLNDSENRLQDNSSRIIFNMNEDIGGGLQGIGQVDIRLSGDNGNIGATGNTYVGLQSNSMGRLTFGRHDLHYGKSPSDIAGLGLLQLAAISLMDYIPSVSNAGAPGATIAIGRGTRTVNVVRWDSPNWSGFTVTGAYSFNAGAPEADLTTGLRKGDAYNLNLGYAASSFKVEWSGWKERPDASLADNAGSVINAWMKMAGFKFGAAYHMKENKSPDGTQKLEANAWTIPVSWESGPHHIYAHYTVADDAKINGNKNDQTGATMQAIAYVYSLSKRTSMSLNYGVIKNDQLAAYRFFTDTGGDLSSGNAGLLAGEKGTVIAFGFRHAF